jgi:predicted outer membrane repeat protein
MTATSTGTTLSNNTAHDGGAIDSDGIRTLSGCSVKGNSATDAGGGLSNARDGHLTLQSRSTVTGHWATILSPDHPEGRAASTSGTTAAVRR